MLDSTVEIAKRNELHTFAVIPKRWGLERSFTDTCLFDFQGISCPCASLVVLGWKNATDSGKIASEKSTHHSK
jgi:hypothetical protein